MQSLRATSNHTIAVANPFHLARAVICANSRDIRLIASPGVGRRLDRRAGHPPALFCAAFTGVRTALKMVHLEFAALRPASLTNVRTDSTDFLHESRIATHVAGRRPTNFGTILVKANAFGHSLNVALAEAGFRTMLALLRALNTGVDAALMFFVAHCILL